MAGMFHRRVPGKRRSTSFSTESTTISVSRRSPEITSTVPAGISRYQPSRTD